MVSFDPILRRLFSIKEQITKELKSSHVLSVILITTLVFK